MWTKEYLKFMLALWAFSNLSSGWACTKLEDTVAWANYYAFEFSVDPDLVLALIEAESSFCLDAVSSKGAIGVMQLMPATAADLGVDPYNPVQNIYGGTKYLRQLFDQFQNWTLAVAAYNAGPNAVLAYEGIPPFNETRAYLLKVHGYYVARK